MSSPVLEDFLEVVPFAREIKRHPRTVKRWIDQPDGLPYTTMGKTILIHTPTARQWLLSRLSNQKKTPRARRKRAAR
jgi:hypothetical protein